MEAKECRGFSGERRPSASLCQRVHVQVKERMDIELAQSTIGASSEPWICWIPPSGNVIKANFDVAFMGWRQSNSCECDA